MLFIRMNQDVPLRRGNQEAGPSCSLAAGSACVYSTRTGYVQSRTFLPIQTLHHRLLDLFYSRANVSSHKRALHIALAPELDVPHHLAIAFNWGPR